MNAKDPFRSMKTLVVVFLLLVGLSNSFSHIRKPPQVHTTKRQCADDDEPSSSSPQHRIAIIGGGASGMFAAANIVSPGMEVMVFEATNEVLRSVRISAAGRENVLFDPIKLKLREMMNIGYPRGKKEMISLLSKKFPPIEQQKWFEDRGVTFQIEDDGRMTASPDSSTTICDAILDTATKAGVKICTNTRIKSIVKNDMGFVVESSSSGEEYLCDNVILATGNSHLGFSIAKSFHHTVQRPLRSCFGFRSTPQQSDTKVELSRLPDGVHKIHSARLTLKVDVPGQKRPRVFKKEGPAELLVRGDDVILSGMGAFHLSSFAALELKDSNYKGKILVHFCPDIGQVERVEELLWERRQDKKYSNQGMAEECPLVHREIDYDNYDFETDSFPTIVTECIPKDVWENLCLNSGASNGYKWSQMSPKKIRALADLVVGYEFPFEGIHTPSDEFVNAGGVSLKEIDLASMESKLVDGLFCCGQILDGDGTHGGFTFMRDFGSALVAAQAATGRATKEE